MRYKFSSNLLVLARRASHRNVAPFSLLGFGPALTTNGSATLLMKVDGFSMPAISSLHGTLVDSSSMNFHLFMAPLFELSNYLVFKLLGVSIFASRLFTALSGSLMIALFWGCLRRAVTPQSLLVGVALIALQSDLVGLSRVAVPEMVVMSFELAIYFLIVLGRSPWRMAAAGVLLLMACGMKATAALMLPIFSVMIFAMPRQATDARRWRDLNLFLTGFLATGTDWRRNRLFFDFRSDP